MQPRLKNHYSRLVFFAIFDISSVEFVCLFYWGLPRKVGGIIASSRIDPIGSFHPGLRLYPDSFPPESTVDLDKAFDCQRAVAVCQYTLKARHHYLQAWSAIQRYSQRIIDQLCRSLRRPWMAVVLHCLGIEQIVMVVAHVDYLHSLHVSKLSL